MRAGSYHYKQRQVTRWSVNHMEPARTIKNVILSDIAKKEPLPLNRWRLHCPNTTYAINYNRDFNVRQWQIHHHWSYYKPSAFANSVFPIPIFIYAHLT